MISLMGRLSSEANSLMILLRMPSGPGAAATLIRDSLRHISDLVTVGGGPDAGREAERPSRSSGGRDRHMEEKCSLMASTKSLSERYQCQYFNDFFREHRQQTTTSELRHHEAFW